MENKFIIKLKKFEDVKNLCSINNKFHEDINICHEHYLIDGKSFMGIYSLGLNKNVAVQIMTDEQERIDKYRNAIAYFMEV